MASEKPLRGIGREDTPQPPFTADNLRLSRYLLWPRIPGDARGGRRVVSQPVEGARGMQGSWRGVNCMGDTRATRAYLLGNKWLQFRTRACNDCDKQTTSETTTKMNMRMPLY